MAMTQINIAGVAALTIFAATACVPQTGISADWPTSPDFPRDSLVPSALPGSTFQGWDDQGGAWITDAGPGWDELWELIYAKPGQLAVVIVTPESYTADGSVGTWRVRTSLVMDNSPDLPVAWEACRLITGPIQPVFARWIEGTTPTDIWTFDPRAGRFSQLPADEVVCESLGD